MKPLLVFIILQLMTMYPKLMQMELMVNLFTNNAVSIYHLLTCYASFCQIVHLREERCDMLIKPTRSLWKIYTRYFCALNNEEHSLP